MKLTIISLYQKEVNFDKWTDELNEIAKEIILIVNRRDLNDNTSFTNKVPVKLINVESAHFFEQYQESSLKSSSKWILFLPMHLTINKMITSEIKNIVTNNLNIQTIYGIRAKEIIFMGNIIKNGGYTKEANGWLYHNTINSLCIFNQKNTQIQASFDTLQPIAFDDFNLFLTWKSQIIGYHQYSKNHKPFLISFFLHPLNQLLYRWVIKKGFLDGKIGFILAYLYALSSFKEQLFLWMKYRRIG
jgi:hypothetical protein